MISEKMCIYIHLVSNYSLSYRFNVFKSHSKSNNLQILRCRLSSNLILNRPTVGVGFPCIRHVKCASLFSPEWTLSVSSSISGGSVEESIKSYCINLNFWWNLLNMRLINDQKMSITYIILGDWFVPLPFRLVQLRLHYGLYIHRFRPHVYLQNQ